MVARVQGSEWSCDATAPQALKFRRSIKPPPPAPHSGDGSGDGRGDGDVSPLQEPSGGGGCQGGCSGGDPLQPPRRPRHLRRRASSARDLDKLVELLARAHNQADFSLIQTAFCIAGCIS